MATTYTSLLGLALPTTGELSGTWGDTVNNYITQYLDAAIAGAQTISGNQTAVTLSSTTGATLVSAGSGSTGSSQYSIINCTGNPASTLTVTVPSTSKVYLVLNATSTSQSVTVKPAGNPGVTVSAARSALIAWNGTDFVMVAANDPAKFAAPTANLPMGGFKHTGVAVSSALTDYLRADQEINSSLQYLTSVVGVNAITASASIAPSAYAAGQTFRFVSAGANTTAVSLNVNSLGVKNVTKNGTTALVAGDIPASAAVEVIYDGTQFQLVNVAPRATANASGDVTLLATGAAIISTGGSERLNILSTGNMSMGTASNAVNAARQFNIANTDSGANAIAQYVATSEVGSFLWQAGSIAGGRLAYINAGSGFTGGLMLDTTGSVPLVLRTNNVERLRIDGSGNFTASVASAMYPAYFCRAWVQFAGATGTMNGNGNVSSVTRNSTGEYTIAFSTAMPDANYAAVAVASTNTGFANLIIVQMYSNRTTNTPQAPTINSFRMVTMNSVGSVVDPEYVTVSVFR
jgi:hypothetical protein